MGIDGYHQRSDQLIGIISRNLGRDTRLSTPSYTRTTLCSSRTTTTGSKKKSRTWRTKSRQRAGDWVRTHFCLADENTDTNLGVPGTRISRMLPDEGCHNHSHIETTGTALWSKILEEGAHGETCKHTYAFASTIAGDIHHANHSPRDQMHDMEMSRFAIDSRFCRQSSSTRCATSERKREKARRFLNNAGHTCYAEQKCSSVRLIGRKLHDGKCTNAQDTW